MQISDLSSLRRRSRDRLPVVLLGGLNVLRALGLGGIPAIVASPDDDEPALFSRYCTARWRLPPLTDGVAVIESLESLAARLKGVFQRPVPLFFSNDAYLDFVNTHRHRLMGRFCMLLNDADTAKALLDKERFAAFAAERGLPVPRSLHWDSTLRNHRGPVLIKPATKHDGNHAAGLADVFKGGKAIIRANGETVLSDPALHRLRNHIVFHEYIGGDDRDLWCLDAVADEHGRILACHTGRKLRCHPPLTGESSYIELRRNAHLEALGRDIAQRVPLRGIFNMDFKRDPSSGRYYLLEINARCNLWNYIGARNGLNLVKVYYDYILTGAPPRHTRYRRRFRWIDFKLDQAACRAMSVHRGLRASRWAAMLMKPKIYSVFAWRDPMPMLATRMRRARDRLYRLNKACS